MNAVEIIRAKRDGSELSAEQVAWVLGAYTRGEVAHEQMSALLMAIVWRGLTPAELTAWTGAMVDSGERLDLSGVGRPVVDKHSSGGVGDKVSLVVAPLVASFGVAVPKLSGRGLGHTGGTLDKLESVPGWRGSLSTAEFLAQLREVGAVIAAAGDTLAPADKRLYALRDVTGTVESVPLIASSIMSKKIAGGADAVLLDVKVGAGAFMSGLEQARELARVMVSLGEASGVRTVALLTSMDEPLGRAVGNALEVAEAVEVLQGGGPPDLRSVCLAVAAEMLALGGLPDVDPAGPLADGRAHDVWRRMISAQGGDPSAALPVAAHTEVVVSPNAGTLSRLDALAVGVASWRLGAGRTRKEDAVDPAAGVVCHVSVGDRVVAGQPLMTLHSSSAELLGPALAGLASAYDLNDGPVEPGPSAAGPGGGRLSAPSGTCLTGLRGAGPASRRSRPGGQSPARTLSRGAGTCAGSSAATRRGA